MKLIHIAFFVFVISIPYDTLSQKKNWEYSISANSTGFLRNTKFAENFRLIEGGGFGQELSYKFKLNKSNSLFLLTGFTFDRRSFFIARDSLTLNQYVNSTIGLPLRLNLYTKDNKWTFFTGLNISYNIKGKVTDLNYQNNYIDYGFKSGSVNPIQLLAEFGIQYNINVLSVFIKRGYGLNKTFTKEFLFPMKVTSLGIAFDLHR